MAVYKRGDNWHFEFTFAGRRIRESAHTSRKTIALEAEKKRRAELERVLAGLPVQDKGRRIRTVASALREYRGRYAVNHRPRSVEWVRLRTVATEALLGNLLAFDLTEARLVEFMAARKRAGLSGRVINMEIGILSRALGYTWRALWPRLKKMEERKDVGRALSPDEERAILAAAARNRSPMVLAFIRVALLTGMRFGEIQTLKWEQIDFEKRTLRVGMAKTAAGTGRVIAMNRTLQETLSAHAGWLAVKLGRTLQSGWYVFPFCNTVKPVDPERPATAIKTAWDSIREAAGVQCRFHDLRHTACTKMAEAGVPEGTMKALMGHMSVAMVERYSHVREEAKRAAVEALTLAEGPDSNGVPTKSPTKVGKVVVQ
jgi:integrase